MAKIGPPPHLPIPPQFSKDRLTLDFFKNLQFLLFQMWTKIGGASDLVSSFEPWVNSTTYTKSVIVTGSDGLFYQLIAGSNLGDDPVTSSREIWRIVEILGLYNPYKNYDVGDFLYTSTGNLWRVILAATGVNPETDDGTYYEPAIDGAKIPEVMQNTTNITQNTSDIAQNTADIEIIEIRTTTAVIHTGSGTLSALRDNEIRDGGAYNIPLAANVSAGQRISIELPMAYATFSPVCTCLGSDLIVKGGGTDNSITFTGPTKIWLTSNGVDRYIL